MNRGDQAPNIDLAIEIVRKEDARAVKVLIDNLANKDKKIQSDCIKVLYEIGERNPELISDYAQTFLGLLDSLNNRLVWGAMTAIDSIASDAPDEVHLAISKINAVGDEGSVITRDHAVSILVKLATIDKYREEALGLLLTQLKKCPPNQLPMYAEKALPVISVAKRNVFVGLLSSRSASLKPAKKKRVESVIKKLGTVSM